MSGSVSMDVAVLAAYGLRDCSDLNLLHYESHMPAFDSKSIESHNAYLHFHAWTLDDILFDPDNHFFYRGVKFCALPVIKQMKMCRQESKDFRDLALIDQVEPSEIPHSSCAKTPWE